jgi:hypothetical protein
MNQGEESYFALSQTLGGQGDRASSGTNFTEVSWKLLCGRAEAYAQHVGLSTK